MSDFVEILGESKATLNKDLRVRLTLESANQLNHETNLVYDVNQEAQFYAEKVACNRFRVYGSVAPTLNLRLRNGGKPNYDLFHFDSNNWQIVLMKPSTYFDDKGLKVIEKKDVFQYDFNYGMPALKVIPAQDEFKNYMAFNMYYGHNIQVDDRIYITSLDSVYLESGYYNVIGVDGNVVYIDQEYVEVVPDFNEDEFTTDISIDEQVATADAYVASQVPKPSLIPPVLTEENEYVETYVKKKKRFLFFKRKSKTVEVRSKYVSVVHINNAAPDPVLAANNSGILNVRNNEIGVYNSNIQNELLKKRPNISKIIKPQFFIKRVQEDYQLEYYMKMGEVIATVKEFNDCAFSLSASGEQVMNFIFDDLDISGLVDNHGIPVTELTLAIIKKSGNDTRDLSDVEANFEKLIDYTDLGHGLEVVNSKQSGSEIDELKIGEKVMLGVFEYDKEELTEVQLNEVHHRTIHKDVAYAYKPFYPFKIKAFSSYVEDSNTKANMPDYAVYSDIKQKYIWRDILDIGFFEQQGVGIDFPFLNDSFYVYQPVVFTVRNDNSVKYKYNTNDINRLDTENIEVEDANDILNDLLQNPTADQDNNKGYQEYKKARC